MPVPLPAPPPSVSAGTAGVRLGGGEQGPARGTCLASFGPAVSWGSSASWATSISLERLEKSGLCP